MVLPKALKSKGLWSFCLILQDKFNLELYVFDPSFTFWTCSNRPNTRKNQFSLLQQVFKSFSRQANCSTLAFSIPSRTKLIRLKWQELQICPRARLTHKFLIESSRAVFLRLIIALINYLVKQGKANLKLWFTIHICHIFISHLQPAAVEHCTIQLGN